MERVLLSENHLILFIYFIPSGFFLNQGKQKNNEHLQSKFYYTRLIHLYLVLCKGGWEKGAKAH